MARTNLNKSKELVTNTQHKITHLGVPESASIEIHPFQTKIYLVKVPLNVNIVKQDLLHKIQFLKIL